MAEDPKTGIIRFWIGRKLDFQFNHTRTNHAYRVVNAVWLDETNLISLDLLIVKPAADIPEKIFFQVPSTIKYDI